jgi:hypothetical protein
VVFVDQSAEAVAAFDSADVQSTDRRCWFGREKRESSVWPLAVVARDIGAECSFEVAAADDQERVEAFGTDGADEALSVGVRDTLENLQERVDAAGLECGQRRSRTR